MKYSAILTSTFIMDIQPALDDAVGDPSHDLHEVAIAIATPANTTLNVQYAGWKAVSVLVSRASMEALADEAQWRYGAWDGAPNRCIAEHYNRFCQQIGRTPQRL